MNCAVHPETTATAFCRTCGKPMCAACARNVRGVIYCEDCLASRIQDPAATGAVPGVPMPVVVAAGPSPGLAGVLAFFFPFGVGQVYTGQYAKGLAHLLIFVALIFGLSSDASDGLHAVLGIAMGFFVVYQIIDAVRSAKALQLGQAPPDPFGLARTFSTAAPADIQKVPVGAVVLIGLGVLFLLDTMDVLRFYRIGKLWPVLLIVLGAWMIMKRVNPASNSGGDYRGGQ